MIYLFIYLYMLWATQLNLVYLHYFFLLSIEEQGRDMRGDQNVQPGQPGGGQWVHSDTSGLRSAQSRCTAHALAREGPFILILRFVSCALGLRCHEALSSPLRDRGLFILLRIPRRPYPTFLQTTFRHLLGWSRGGPLLFALLWVEITLSWEWEL